MATKWLRFDSESKYVQEVFHVLMQGLNWHAVPAFLAVISCIVILFLTHHRGTNTYTAQLYRAVVLLWLLHNSCELVLFVFANNSLVGTLQVGLLYYTLSVIAIAALSHLSLVLATDLKTSEYHRYFLVALYAPAALLQIPLWFSDWMISGYSPDDGIMPGVAWNSLHGEGYIYLLLIGFAIYMAITTVTLLVGIRSDNKQRRLQCYVVLFSSAPLFLFANDIIFQLLRILPLNSYLNTTFAAPFGIIIFCIGTGYAIYRYRLVDIEFYIPWSKQRRAKTQFYRQIQVVSDFLPRSYDPQEAMRQVSIALNCAVVVKSKDQTLMTPSPHSSLMAELPVHELSNYDRIVTVDEMSNINPTLANLLRDHKIFAAVPIPQGAGPDAVVTWVLLGEELSERLYSSRDFAMVGMLFQRMETVFINQLGTVRQEISELRGMVSTLTDTCTSLTRQVKLFITRQPIPVIDEVSRQVIALANSEEENVAEAMSKIARGTLYLGRDRELFGVLRAAFPHMRRLASPASAALEKYQVPAVIIYDRTNVSETEESKLVGLLEGAVHPVAIYVLGAQAERFCELYSTRLNDVEIFSMPPDYTSDDIIRKVRKDYDREENETARPISLEEIVAAFEKRVIELALLHAAGDQTVAAHMLDLRPITLYRRIVKHRIVIPNQQPLLEQVRTTR